MYSATVVNYFSLPSFLVLFILFLIFQYLKNNYKYWENLKVPHLNSVPLFGDYGKFILQKEYSGKTAQSICQKFPKEPYIGTFYGTEPALLVQDPDLLKVIMTKDFYYFNGREVSVHSDNEIITQNLFFTYGDKWKLLRQHLTSLFSSSKMKRMFPLIKTCNDNFEKMLRIETKAGDELEVKSLMVNYTMDVICSCVFGIETNLMTSKDKSDPFRHIGNEIFEISNWRGFSLVCRAIWPSIFYRLGLKVFPVEIDRFFYDLIGNIIEKRQNKPSDRNDIIDCMLSLQTNGYITGDFLNNTKADVKEKFIMKYDNNIMIAQCISFFAAGFETSSSTMSYTLYEFAKNKEVQRLAMQEVDAYFEKHKSLNYDCITDLPYLDACVDETLRLYPVLGLLTREVMEDHKLPTGLRLKRGVRVHIPVYHLHRHPDFFPDPEEYHPERFYLGNKQNIRPYTYIPFGAGPRLCIGLRLAKLLVLAGLSTVLRNYHLELGQDTPKTLTFDPRSLTTNSVGGIKLKLVPRGDK